MPQAATFSQRSAERHAGALAELLPWLLEVAVGCTEHILRSAVILEDHAIPPTPVEPNSDVETADDAGQLHPGVVQFIEKFRGRSGAAGRGICELRQRH